MKNTYYLLKNGELRRKDNNLIVKACDGSEKVIPIETVKEIYIMGEVNVNSKLMTFLSQNSIILHFFNYYGFYSGSYYPKEKLVSGSLLVKQVEHYRSKEKRVELAREVLKSASYNIKRNLRYYNERGRDLEDEIKTIKNLRKHLDRQNEINELMGVEGNIREGYYRAWNKIVNQDINFEKRVKHPPDNMINSLLSYVNSLVYTTVLSEIYHTQLNPTISFLHEPSTKRFSLSLDIAEIFKPILGERMIFSLLNKNMINEDSFEKEMNSLYLKDSARKVILQKYDSRLKQRIRHKVLKKNVSYRYLIRLECYKIIKHILGEKNYEGFKIWW
ncbi:CRISPR-associated Cas1 family protein [Hypnocyclicus thermotrophus]|uniref:CRISPR-associated endonuclease Cas1 n=1 Tax=Hypnocyclicus thermotrophus TaxID=1627895 RepID=A0AA46DXA3_9FUSO|nr:type I-B CRISPR-associated endonuclease Cas1b [Hypnocyclicus thermotrophus]TDT67029.1 CRISPR-associated Cas1 family protein [Hypnocyclicus thermotrophus]